MESRDNRELAPTTGVEGGTGATKPGVWQSVTTIPWAWLSAGLIASALFAGGVALFSTDPRHRLWGQAAVGGYALAALAVMAWRSRRTHGVDLALAAMMCGAILFPLLWLIAHGYGEPEVGVVATSAKELIQDGTPYRSAQALAATTNPNQYNPYLPLMAVFGVPQALLGHTIVVILLVGTGLAIAVSLVVRPPRDVPAATIRLVLGLSAMFVLAPSTRFGYFIYPAALVLWLLASQAGRALAERPAPEVLVSSNPLPHPGAGLRSSAQGLLWVRASWATCHRGH